MNAKSEFIKHIEDRGIKCATITYGMGYSWEAPTKSIALKCNYTPEEFEIFLKELDFNYNSGYGGQELFGVIWYIDGTWSERGEYDGSEWWNHNSCPNIPNELI